MRRRDFGVLHNRTSDVSISEAARPAPRRRHRMRNGRPVTPAIGASTAREGSVKDPTRSGRAAGSASGSIVGADHLPGGLLEAGIDLEADRVLAGIDESHLGIDALPGLESI